MADRFDVNIRIVRDKATGAPVEMFEYSGAYEIQVSKIESFAVEFRGRLPGPAVGADAAAKMADAEKRAKTEVQSRLDAMRAAIPNFGRTTDGPAS